MNFILILLLPILLMSNDKIQELFELESYKEACYLTDIMYEKDPYSFKSNLYYAKCAHLKGDYDQAMAAYERADILKEEDVSVHKNLGDLHAKIGNIQIANLEYDKADQFGQSLVQRATVQKYNPHKISLLLSFSSGYDSNVNYNAELADMGEWLGTPPSAIYKPVSDMYVKEYLRFSHVYNANPYSAFYYKTQASIYNKNYFELDNEDFLQANVKTGLGWSAGTFDVWLPIAYTYTATAYDSYAKAYSFNPKIRYRFENKILLSLSAKYELQKYLQWKGSDKNNLFTYLSASRWFGKNYFRVSYNYLSSDKKDKNSPNVFIDRTSSQIKLNYSRKLFTKVELGLSMLHRESSYDDLIRSDSVHTRDDKLISYGAYLSYNLSQSLILNTRYKKYNNTTNYTPSNYKKDVLNFGVSYYY